MPFLRFNDHFVVWPLFHQVVPTFVNLRSQTPVTEKMRQKIDTVGIFLPFCRAACTTYRYTSENFFSLTRIIVLGDMAQHIFFWHFFQISMSRCGQTVSRRIFFNFFSESPLGTLHFMGYNSWSLIAPSWRTGDCPKIGPVGDFYVITCQSDKQCRMKNSLLARK